MFYFLACVPDRSRFEYSRALRQASKASSKQSSSYAGGSIGGRVVEGLVGYVTRIGSVGRDDGSVAGVVGSEEKQNKIGKA